MKGAYLTPGFLRSDDAYCPPIRIIVDTDSAAIASRVSRARPDVTEIQINEQTIMNAYQTVRDRVAQRIGQL